MSIIIFFLVLFILVLVHEWGHFIVAKKTGMRVDEFGIGFPPKLFGIKKGETEYTFNALPIGGFVKIFGENYEDKTGEVDPRGFSSRPRWAQALVLIAGVTMNILFAWFLFSLTYMIGAPTQVDEASASPQAQLYIAGVLENSPAQELPVGSVVTSVESGEKRVDTPNQTNFSEMVNEAAESDLLVTYEYKDEIKTLALQPTQGLIDGSPDEYAVGVSLALVDVVSKPFFTAIGDGFNSTRDGFVAIAVGLYSLLSEAVIGKADFSQVAGPIGIVGMVGDAASFGITALLTFTAIISLNLAVINLLPFPALDGGRLVFVAIEAITKKPIPPEWAGRVNLVGFAMLMLLMIVVTYNDILRLL
jgi:regulator of sigma E protease